MYSFNGYIATNDHVVSETGESSGNVRVTLASSDILKATIIARDS